MVKLLHTLEKFIQGLSASMDFLNVALPLPLALARYLIQILSALTELERCQRQFKM
jgi:hypothetical protein